MLSLSLYIYYNWPLFYSNKNKTGNLFADNVGVGRAWLRRYVESLAFYEFFRFLVERREREEESGRYRSLDTVSTAAIIRLNRRKFMDADPSVYDSSPREMKKEEKSGGGGGGDGGCAIKFIMFAYFMQREAKVYIKLTVRALYGLIAECVRGGRTKSLGIGSLKGNLLKAGPFIVLPYNTRGFLFPPKKKKNGGETRVERSTSRRVTRYKGKCLYGAARSRAYLAYLRIISYEISCTFVLLHNSTLRYCFNRP